MESLLRDPVLKVMEGVGGGVCNDKVQGGLREHD